MGYLIDFSIKADTLGREVCISSVSLYDSFFSCAYCFSE